METVEEKPTRILNCGCGNQNYGTDFLDLYPQRGEVIAWNANNQKIPFPDNTFDIVYSGALLEHVRNLGFLMSEFARVTKPGGKVRIETDNGKYWRWVIGFGKTQLHEYHGYHSDYGKSDRHYCIFYPAHVKQLLESVNLTVTYEGWKLIGTKRKKLDRLVSLLNDKISYPMIVVEAIKPK